MSDTREKTAKLYEVRLFGNSKLADIKPELTDLAFEQAAELHADFLASQRALGYTYGETYNADPEAGPLTDPEVTEFEELEASSQDLWMASTDIARKLYINAHKNVNLEVGALLYTIAKQVHNTWAREMLEEGWKYGPQNDTSAKTCASLLPFDTLLNDPELEQYTSYAIEVARNLLINLADNAECAHPVAKLSKRFTEILSNE